MCKSETASNSKTCEEGEKKLKARGAPRRKNLLTSKIWKIKSIILFGFFFPTFDI